MNSKVAETFLQRCIEPDCGQTYDVDTPIYTCTICNGLLDITWTEPQKRDPDRLRSLWSNRKLSNDQQDQSGVWRFREILPFEENSPIVSLKEGNTPLYDAPKSAAYCRLDSLQLKHQGANPTGSFKDTGMTVAVTQACVLGARLVACASTGNTAASLAAYAARAALPCAILVPTGQVSHAKLAQALDYGASVLEIEGNFDSCMRLIRELSEDGSLYLVNSINPFRIEGQKTVAFELAEQLEWDVPDHLVVPGGNLGNSSAFGKGFRELLTLGLVKRLPRISVVQAAGASPFAKYFAAHQHSANLQFVDETTPRTLASAIKIGAPVSWKKALRAVEETNGTVLTVTEQEIADAKAVIGAEGVGCEPASATTVAGIRKLQSDGSVKSTDRVVAVLTGHVLKDTDYVNDYHNNSLSSDTEGLIRGKFINRPVQITGGREELRSVLASLHNGV
jgi:threonine synthase